MKKKLLLLLLIPVLVLPYACKKETTINTGISALNVVNATVDAPSISINFSSSPGTYSSFPVTIPNASNLEFGLPAGTNTINLISSLDTSKTLFHDILNLKIGGVYSLYLIGQSPNTDTLFMKDNLPAYQDSSSAVRFINLSPDSGPLNINLVGSTQKDFSGLSYKKITDFKKYPATSIITNNGGYIYEIRTSSGTLLTTFNFYPSVFKDNTLVISGSINSANLGVFQINNF